MHAIGYDKKSKANVVISFPSEDKATLDSVPNRLKKSVFITDKDIDVYFLDAYEIDVKKETFKINLEKARNVKLNKLRITRNKLLEKLDFESLKYLGNTPKLNQIQLEKQVLRDVTTEISNELNKMDDLEMIKNYSHSRLEG